MIEYLHSTIRATAGDSVTITAKITDSAGAVIQETCSLCLYDGSTKLLEVEGILEENIHSFTIAADVTAALTGRYWYKVCDSSHNSLDFMQPIYFITRGKANDKFEAGKQFAEAAVKPELKAAIEERGAVIPDEAGLDEYAGYLRSCPNASIGTFTPEEDTAEFEVRGLPFAPTVMVIHLPHTDYEEYNKMYVVNGTIFKGSVSNTKVIKGQAKYTNLSVHPSYEGDEGWHCFYNDGVKYAVPESYGVVLRAGYTYHYVIA